MTYIIAVLIVSLFIWFYTDGQVIVFKKGDWLYGDRTGPEYIRLKYDVRKRSQSDQWGKIYYHYFEPDGSLKSDGMWSFEFAKYVKFNDNDLKDKLEKSYHKKTKAMEDLKIKKQDAMRKKALKAFLASIVLFMVSEVGYGALGGLTSIAIHYKF